MEPTSVCYFSLLEPDKYYPVNSKWNVQHFCWFWSSFNYWWVVEYSDELSLVLIGWTFGRQSVILQLMLVVHQACQEAVHQGVHQAVCPEVCQNHQVAPKAVKVTIYSLNLYLKVFSHIMSNECDEFVCVFVCLLWFAAEISKLNNQKSSNQIFCSLSTKIRREH